VEVFSTMKELKISVKKKDIDGKEHFLFNYSDDSERGNPIVNGCRGTVWSYESDSHTWTCIRSAFDRFFNHGESHDYNRVDLPETFDDVKVFEKLDGTLLFVTSDGENLTFGTRNLFDLNDFRGTGGKNLNPLVLELIEEAKQTIHEHNDKTFLFELCTPWNQVVVHHPKPMIVLLGVRSNSDPFDEHDPKDFDLKIPLPETFDFNDFDACQSHVQRVGGAKFEGVVLKFGSISNPKRLKLKSSEFLSLSKTQKPAGAPEELIMIGLIENDFEEILAVHPYWREKIFPPLEKKFHDFIVKMNDVQAELDLMPSPKVMKDYGKKAQESPMRDFHFKKLKNDKLDLMDYLRSNKDKVVKNLLS